ncbi:MAG: FHA domain-containing protein [Pseudomonadota bacterium]
MELAFDVQGRRQAQLLVAGANSDGTWRVGRAFTADIIIRDPAVDAVQLEFWHDEDDQLWVRDCASTNGSTLNGKPLGADARAVKSGATLAIGTTTLQVYRRDHPIATTLPTQTAPGWSTALGRVPVILAATTVGAATQLFFHYLGFGGEYELQPAVRELFGYGMQVLGWTLFWGIAARLLRGEFVFGPQWTIGALLIGLTPLLDEFVALIGFNLQSLTAYRTLDAVMTAGVLVLGLYLTYSLTTHFSRARRWAFAIAPAALLMVSVYLIPLLGSREPVGSPQTLGLSRPPSLQLRSGVPAADLVGRQARLFDAVTTLAEEDRDDASTAVALDG